MAESDSLVLLGMWWWWFGSAFFKIALLKSRAMIEKASLDTAWCLLAAAYSSSNASRTLAWNRMQTAVMGVEVNFLGREKGRYFTVRCPVWGEQELGKSRVIHVVSTCKIRLSNATKWNFKMIDLSESESFIFWAEGKGSRYCTQETHHPVT